MSKLLFREARLGLIIWLLGLISLSVANAGAIAGMFNTDELWKEYISTVRTPFGVIFTGPGIGLDPNIVDIGSACIGKLFVIICIAVVIMNVNYVVNWNRGFEEDGRTELLLALPVKRWSLQNASIINLTVFNAIFSVLVALFFIAMQLPALDTMLIFLGYFLFCELWLLVGLLASAIFSVARTAKFAATGLFLATFIIGVVGWAEGVAKDTSAIYPDLPWYCWVSPMHWLFEMRPYVSVTTFPLTILVALITVLTVVNYLVYAKRDMGAALVGAKSGRQDASVWLSSIFALRFRQVRITTLGWGLAVAALGAAWGSMVQMVGNMISSSEVVQQMMRIQPEAGQATVDQMTTQALNGFLGYITLFIMFIISGFVISQASAIFTRDESNGTYEIIFAKPISRAKYMCQSQSVALLSLAFVTLCGISAYTIASKLSISSVSVPDMLIAGLVSAVIPLFFLSLAILLHSLNAKLTPLTWAYFAFSVVITMFADILKTPDWLNSLAITNHFGAYPIEFSGDNSIVPVLAVCLDLSAVFYCTSFVFYKKRDL